MYLDYSIWKFPIPRLGEGGKRRGKLSHWLYKLKFLPFIPISLRGRGGRASDFLSQGPWFDPWWEQNFFSLFYLILIHIFIQKHLQCMNRKFKLALAHMLELVQQWHHSSSTDGICQIDTVILYKNEVLLLHKWLIIISYNIKSLF